MKRLPDFEFVIYEPADCPVASWFGGASNVLPKRTPLPSEGRAEKFVMGYWYWQAALLQQKHNLFEAFHLPLVKAPTGRTLLTIHDIRGLREYGALEQWLFKNFLGKSLKAVDHVLTVSQTMKEEILNFFPNVQISVIYNGLDSGRFECISEGDLQVVRRAYALPKQFVLAVGHLEKRKNYLRLLQAVALLRDRKRSCPLVIVGNDSGLRREIEKKIAAMNLSSFVTILSGIDDHELRCVYKLCNLLVFPSSYEGFGIPILEAMAAGRPMVLSDLPVFREITQGKGVYFAHDHIESMAFAIEQVLSVSSERVRLVEYGNERVRAFSFASLAGQVEHIYRSLA